MFDIKKVGTYIKILRKAKGFTQGVLADMIGVSHQAVSNWERGEALPDVTLLLDLAHYLGVSVDNLLSASRDDFTLFDEILNSIEIVPRKSKQIKEKKTENNIKLKIDENENAEAQNFVSLQEICKNDEYKINELEMIKELEEQIKNL